MKMKMLVVSLAVVFFLPLVSEAGMFDWDFSGYVEGSAFLKNNEHSQDTSLEVYLEVRPEDFPRLFFFTRPFLFFGDDGPPRIRERTYITSLDFPGGYVQQIALGVGYQLFKEPDIQIRATYWNTREPNGYEGDWNAVQFRWTFGKR